MRFSGSIFPSKASSSTVALTRTTGRDLDKKIGLLNVLFEKIIDNSNDYLISMEELFRSAVSTFSKVTLTILWYIRTYNMEMKIANFTENFYFYC